MLARLTLSGFRTYESARLDVSHPLVVLHGDNGAGKTNALEALSLFASGRGLRGAALDEMQQQHAATSGWGVSLHLADGTQLGTGVSASAPRRRAVRINGEAGALSDIAERLSLLWLTPLQDRLFTDSPSDRRRFIDRLVQALYPGHAGHVARYEHAMRERLRLLSEGTTDTRWLAALEGRIAEHGTAAAAARLDVVSTLAPLAAEQLSAGFPPAIIACQGDVEALLQGGAPALAVEEQLASRLAANRSADAAAGRTSFGPGHSDIAVRHGPKNQPAALCSTGEQKALLTGMMLAQARLIHARRGPKPLLLFDEIAAHLDERRRSGLFDLLEGLRIPCWMTGTDARLFQSLNGRATFALVRDGQFHL